MSVVALYLFGSHARGDYTSQSDIDVLAVTEERGFRKFGRGKLNVSFYPADKMIASAERGDLFLLHIYLEAVLIDGASQFDKVFREKFKRRQSYLEDLERASDLGWFLVREHDRFTDSELWNKRVAWAVRTLLIARSVEEGRPKFSPSELCKIVDFDGIDELLARKSKTSVDSEAVEMLRQFLSRHGQPIPDAFVSGDHRKQWQHFRRTENRLGLHTFNGVERANVGEFY